MANKEVILKNVELRWAYLAEPQTKGEFASNKYQVDVVLNKDTAAQIKTILSPRQSIKEKDGEMTVALKSSVKPHVYIKENGIKRLMSDEEMKKVGNGTKAMVKATQYTTKKYGAFAGLGAILITDLKQYSTDDDFGDDDGDVFAESVEDDGELI